MGGLHLEVRVPPGREAELLSLKLVLPQELERRALEQHPGLKVWQRG